MDDEKDIYLIHRKALTKLTDSIGQAFGNDLACQIVQNVNESGWYGAENLARHEEEFWHKIANLIACHNPNEHEQSN